MTDHDELRRLAEAATPAYRLVQGECANPALAIDWYDGEVVVFWPGSFNDRPDEDVLAWRMDAEFIAAADPQTVLGLLDEIDRLRERQESADLANEGIRLKRRAIKAERERDELRAKVERVRTVLAETENPQWDDGDPDWIEDPAGVFIDMIRRALDGGGDE